MNVDISFGVHSGKNLQITESKQELCFKCSHEGIHVSVQLFLRHWMCLVLAKKAEKSTQQCMTFPLLTLLHSMFWGQTALMSLRSFLLHCCSADFDIYWWSADNVADLFPAKCCLLSLCSQSWCLFLFCREVVICTCVTLKDQWGGESGHKTIGGHVGGQSTPAAWGLNGADRREVQMLFR